MNNTRSFLAAISILFAVLMAACSGTTPTAETEALKPAEIAVSGGGKTTGPTTGDIAPDFTLPDGSGNMVHLADELQDHRMVILVYYHAYT
jgi:cytochrome oxidase Cu insertion factor (SCO1/SenC/PrrC family)